MPKYMVTGTYTVEGMKGVLEEGGTGRVEAVKKLVQAVGGTLEAMYFAFGSDDFVILVDLPDNVTGAAQALAVAATGTVNTRVTVLLTAEEVDAATKMAVSYRPPGK